MRATTPGVPVAPHAGRRREDHRRTEEDPEPPHRAPPLLVFPGVTLDRRPVAVKVTFGAVLLDQSARRSRAPEMLVELDRGAREPLSAAARAAAPRRGSSWNAARGDAPPVDPRARGRARRLARARRRRVRTVGAEGYLQLRQNAPPLVAAGVGRSSLGRGALAADPHLAPQPPARPARLRRLSRGTTGLPPIAPRSSAPADAERPTETSAGRRRAAGGARLLSRPRTRGRRGA
jgi:hypothetical protein